jgi:hypothetical protein
MAHLKWWSYIQVCVNYENMNYFNHLLYEDEAIEDIYEWVSFNNN